MVPLSKKLTDIGFATGNNSLFFYTNERFRKVSYSPTYLSLESLAEAKRNNDLFGKRFDKKHRRIKNRKIVGQDTECVWVCGYITIV